MDDGEDPFAALIIPKCQITSSQEEVLQSSCFVGESESVMSQSTLGASWFEEPATEIIMASLPESHNVLNYSHEDEDFITPPEHYNSQHFSNDDQAPMAPKTSGDRKNDCGSGGQATELDDWDAFEQKVACFGKNSDKLGFSKLKGNSEVDGGVGGLRVDNRSGDDIVEVVEVSDDESRKIAGLEGEICESRVRTEKLGTGTSTSNDVDMVEAEETETEKGGVANFELEAQEAFAGLANRLLGLIEKTPNVSDKMPVRELEEVGCVGLSEKLSVENSVRKLEKNVVNSKSQKTGENGPGGLACKSIEEIEKFKYVRPEGRRELPCSLREQGKNVEEEARMAKKRNLENLLHGLKLVLGEVDDGEESIDIIETAKSRGLTFPRPRWWKPGQEA